jgi:2-hydroxyisobutanoyl-CoA mutase large subunit
MSQRLSSLDLVDPASAGDVRAIAQKFDIETHNYDPTTAERQIGRLNRVRRERDAGKIERLLDQLIAVARDEKQNIMPVTIELVKNGASMGDIIERLKTLWGTYREMPVF